MHMIRCSYVRPGHFDAQKTKQGTSKRRRRVSCSLLTTHAVTVFIFFRSAAVKEMCCIFWMLVTHAMPTGCGLSIRRLHKSRRTWQPYRYISSEWTRNPSDLPKKRQTRKTMIHFTGNTHLSGQANDFLFQKCGFKETSKRDHF